MLNIFFLLSAIAVAIQGRSYVDPPVNRENHRYPDPPLNGEEAFAEIQKDNRGHIPDIPIINHDLTFKKGQICEGMLDVDNECINLCNGVIDDYETDKNGCYVSCKCITHYGKLYQSDIIVTEKNKEAMDYMYKNIAPPNLGDIQNGLTSLSSRLWPIDASTSLFFVPYIYSTTSPPTQRVRNAVDAAIADFNTMTCVRFRNRTSETNYITIQDGDGCSSFVGRVGGSQTVTLADGCGTKEIVIHEFMHALGFHHEQSRPDRDTFVTVFLANVQPGLEHNFDIASNINSRGSPYDYRSLMHYGTHFFTSNGMATLLPTNASFTSIIGTGTDFSVQDLFQINHPTVYNCPASTTAPPTTGSTATTPAPTTGSTATTPAPTTASTATTQAPTTASTATTQAPTTAACTNVDTLVNCLTNAYNYQCSNPTISQQCRRTCGVCGCEDNFPWPCGVWSGLNYCNNQLYINFMTTNCRVSCGICSN